MSSTLKLYISGDDNFPVLLEIIAMAHGSCEKVYTWRKAHCKCLLLSNKGNFYSYYVQIPFFINICFAYFPLEIGCYRKELLYYGHTFYVRFIYISSDKKVPMLSENSGS